MPNEKDAEGKDAEGKDADEKDAETQEVPGRVETVFDAGGVGNSVSINPVTPLMTSNGDESFSVTWQLARPLHGAPGFAVQFSNIVPCDLAELPKGYELDSGPVADDGGGANTAWRWTFRMEEKYQDSGARERDSVPMPEELRGIINYDIFFTYQPKGMPPPPPGKFVCNLRKTAIVDPTLVLPPSSSGGAGG